MRLIDKEDIYEASQMKRLLEYITLVPGFKEKFEENPEEMIKEIGVDVDPHSAQFNSRMEGNVRYMDAVIPGGAADKYAKFVNNKVDMREKIKDKCVPKNPTMKKWRERQIGRCNMQLGARVVALVHSPFTIELADGCSVGCEFCGLNAGRLKSVCRYTEENAQLFRDILQITKEIMGDAAGQGTLYFASEPLDNPDYELFLKDYREILGTLPQITTATALRHKERMHKLLAELNDYGEHIYRFSCLSLESFYEIMEEFTPEELMLVEVLPQFEEAPDNKFAQVGRNVTDDNFDDTISCVSGFIVNMARKEIRITTPAPADKEHPTGEYILYTGNFTDANSYKEIIEMCIKKYMGFVLGPKEEIRLRKNLSYVKKEYGFLISCDKGMEYEFRLSNNENASGLVENLLKSLEGDYKTRHQVVYEVVSKIDGMAAYSNLVFRFLNSLWAVGLIEIKSGLI